MILKEEMERYYEIWWENPKDPRNFIFEGLNKLVYKRLPSGEGRHALDIGSGKGRIISFLLAKGYKVTAVELNERFVREIRRKFPSVKVIRGDFTSIKIKEKFDLITAIEFIQNLAPEQLLYFFEKTSTLGDKLIFNISNRNSLHGLWTKFRNFQKPFVYTYTPTQILRLVKNYGYKVAYQQGIGLLTPVTLLNGFRFKLIPILFAKGMNFFGDRLLPRYCHLYYFELVKE